MAKYTVKPNQSLFDVALHIYGSIEGLFDLLISNPQLSMTSELSYGQELEYHEEFILNPSIVDEFQKQGITPSAGKRKVYFKQPEEDLVCIVPVETELKISSFKAAGEGEMIIDWGDNTELQHILLTPASVFVEHYFDNETDKRRIKIYGDTKTMKFTKLDTSELGGPLVLCKPLVVDEYTCVGRGYSLTGLALLEGTYKIDLFQSIVSTLLPLGDMSLQELDLRGVYYMSDDILDEYLEYIVANYGSRRSCTVRLTTEPSERSYTAINTILNEPEWNVAGEWKFYINNQLYQPTNDTIA